MIRNLTKEEMKEVYESYMIHDFPSNELKSLKKIEESIYSRYGYFEENKLIGYAVVVENYENQCLLLDYFAILPDNRKQGKGLRFLEELKEKYRLWKMILIESEAEKSETAIKRINFYKRAKAKATSIVVRLYHVDYRILMIPLSENLNDRGVVSRTHEIYKKMYEPKILEQYLEYHVDAC